VKIQVNMLFWKYHVNELIKSISPVQTGAQFAGDRYLDVIEGIDSTTVQQFYIVQPVDTEKTSRRNILG